MRERKERNWNPTQEQIAEAMTRYEKLLEHHNIDQAVQDKVWVTVLKDFEDNPGNIVRKIQGYWETAFGVNGRNLSNESEKSDAELSLNNRRQRWRNKSFEISREGNRTKARKKARKEAKKRKKSAPR